MENEEEFRKATIDEINNLKDEIDIIKIKSKFLHRIVGLLFVFVIIISISCLTITNVLF